jgi:hypothetical protein
MTLIFVKKWDDLSTISAHYVALHKPRVIFIGAASPMISCPSRPSALLASESSQPNRVPNLGYGTAWA